MTASGELDAAIPVGVGEVGVLASRFTEPIEMLRTSREARRRLVADAYHELRSPLTSIRMNLETLVEDGALPSAPRSPQFQAAQKACAQDFPGGSPP